MEPHLLILMQYEESYSCFQMEVIQMVNFLQFLNQHSMTTKTVSQIFPVMFQSLLKPHYVYAA
jgi:hypothetical protein